MVPRTPEGEALRCWLTERAAYYSSFGETERAQRDSLLDEVYRLTRPKLASEDERKKHESAARKLRELLPMVDSTVKALKVCGSEVFPKDGTPPITMSELLLHLEESAFIIKGSLLYLDRPHMRSADVLSYSLTFVTMVMNCGVVEADALGLARLAMKAHGFTDDELGVFSDDSRKVGTPRKRRKDVISHYFDVVESYLEQYRKHNNIPEFNPAQYRQKKDHVRKNPPHIPRD